MYDESEAGRDAIRRRSLVMFGAVGLVNAAIFGWVAWTFTHLGQPAIELFRSVS